MKPKFAKVSCDLKMKVVNEYLTTNQTTKELGRKYGFSHRRIRQWFIEINKLDEFKKKAHQNMVSFNKQPKDPASMLKMSGFNNLGWKGKKLEVRNGYIRSISILAPSHPDANKDGYVPEHRLVMEEKIGRRLKKEEIPHHVDLNPSNNHPDNLILLDNSSEHAQLHHYLQLALVQLMDKDDLIKLNEYLIKLIKIGSGPLRHSCVRFAKRRRDKIERKEVGGDD
jgi:hypothetical protein